MKIEDITIDLQATISNLNIQFNVQTEGYGNTEDERGSDWFYTAEEAILFIKNKLIYIYEKYPKN